MRFGVVAFALLVAWSAFTHARADFRDDTSPMPHVTVDGPIGGVHVVDGSSGQPRTFRLALFGRWLRDDGFIVKGDGHRRTGTVLTLSITPIEHLELAASASGMSTENRATDPQLVQMLGDARLFAKGYGSIAPWLSVSGDLEVRLMNGVGGIGYAPAATSVGLRGAATVDLREPPAALPIVLRANVGYLFDNSAKLVESVEAARYASLNDPSPAENEYRHLVSDIERYQVQVQRVDSLTLAFGVETPLELAQNWRVSPLLEWSVALPVNRQDYDCLVSNAPSDRDSCLSREGFAARSSKLTFGMRGEPGIRGLSLLMSVDVATSGHRSFVRELAPTSRYEVVAGLGYAYDTRPPKPVVVQKVVKIAPEPEARGFIAGDVLDRESAQPVPRAIVHIEGGKLSDLAADRAGKFVTYDLAPGTYGLRVSAPDYREALCVAKLEATVESVAVRCELEPLPRLGAVLGRVSGPNDEPVVGASIALRGPSSVSVRTDASGTFAARELPIGPYEVRVEADGYLMKATNVAVHNKQEANASLSLVPMPKQRLTALETNSIAIKRQVQFVPNSAEIREQSDLLLADVADVLIRNPQLLRVEVGGHTDDTGTDAYNMELSQARADAVRSWLVSAGVDPSRLTAVGYGRAHPVAPNITAANRARNRRVEFVILEVR